MNGDYKKTEKLLVRKSLFALAQEPSFAKRFVPEFVACKAGMNILDVGCGTGEDLITISTTVPHCKLFGLDSSKGMIEDSKNKIPNATLFVANMETFTLAEKFDRIIVRHALHLANDKTKAVQNIVNHLAPEGEAIFALHSTESLKKMNEIVEPFCRKYHYTFPQGKDALAIETSEELFAPYHPKKEIVKDIITLTDPEPYLNYMESRRNSFIPNITNEHFAELLEDMERKIRDEIKTNDYFSEYSINGIITIKNT